MMGSIDFRRHAATSAAASPITRRSPLTAAIVIGAIGSTSNRYPAQSRRSGDREQNACRKAGNQWPRRVRHDDADILRRTGAERRADSDLPRARRHRKRGDRINSRPGEGKRGETKHADQHEIQPPGSHGGLQDFIHRYA